LTRVALMTPVAVVCAVAKVAEAAANIKAIIARFRIDLCLLNIFAPY
jgi:hypothetical protein